MRVGTLLTLPDEYTRFATVKDKDGGTYTVDSSQVPPSAKEGREYAYKVEIWENDSGIAYDLEEA